MIMKVGYWQYCWWFVRSSWFNFEYRHFTENCNRFF